jgi:DNA primase
MSRHLEQCLDDPRWTVGYAPPRWSATLTYLRDHGFTDTEIVASGLATAARTGNLIDRFRDRLVIGIRDAGGELVGFTGRAAPRARRDVPRYLNSPSTDIFKKRELLFGLAEQSARLSAGAIPVIVEGSLDVLAVAPTTTEFVPVSPCGTALTAAQVSALRAASTGGTTVVAYDGDPAGRKASVAAYPLLARSFEHLTFAHLPEGHDPASLAASDPDGLCRVIKESDPLADLLIDHAIDRHPDHPGNAEARVNALHEATHLIATLMPTDVAREVTRTASRLGLHHSTVSNDLADVLSEVQSPSTRRKPAALPQARASELPKLRATR